MRGPPSARRPRREGACRAWSARLLVHVLAARGGARPPPNAATRIGATLTAVDYTKPLRGEALVLCAALLGAAFAQAPTQKRGARAPVPRVKHDTIYVAVQAPPPTIIVEAPSQVPAVVLGVLGLGLVAFQIWMMRRQTRIMERQTGAMETQSTLLAKQTELGEQQAAWRRDEAVGTFYRMAFDLAEEFRKANVGPVGSSARPRLLGLRGDGERDARATRTGGWPWPWRHQRRSDPRAR